jgi:CBS domain-containing protein
MFVKDAMVKNIVSIPSTISVFDAAVKMTQNNIGSLIVVDESLEGIVTERDILNKIVSADRNPRQTRVKEIMSANVITISPDADMEEASDLMTKNKIKRLPVVFGDEVVGIITSTDVVAILSRVIKEIYSQQ